MEDSASSLPNSNSDPSPQIQQNVGGDGNQVTGQVTGGNVFGHITGNVTIYERVPVSSMPPPINVLPTLTQQEYHQRQALLDKVQDYWVKGKLENSLHSRALIKLRLQERPDLVQQPFSDVAEFSDAPGQVLLNGIHVTAVFEEMGARRSLLISGEPGAGKTTALLKLAEDLISRTKKGLQQKIPVVLHLSYWKRNTQSIEKWLVQELWDKYDVPRALGKTWVKSETLILLLDGLDEVQADQHDACVKALNLFRQNYGTTEIVVCCRILDYQALSDKLFLRKGICIQPLTTEQISSYINRAGDQLNGLKNILQYDETLQVLATSPLMLDIMSLAYQDIAIEEIALNGDIDNYRKILFEAYINRMFQRRGMTIVYQREYTQRCLVWLAKKMLCDNQTFFSMERLQPSWLLYKNERFFYQLATGVLGGISLGSILGLIHSSLHIFLSSTISYGLLLGFQNKIKTVETLSYSQKEAFNGFLYALYPGALFALSLFLIAGLTDVKMILSGTVALGFLSGFVGLIGALRGPEMQNKKDINEGIMKSARNAGMIFLIVFVFFEIYFRIYFGIESGFHDGWKGSLTAGIIYGLILGGNAYFRHIILRCMLYYLGYAPRNYEHFLAYATERIFLQKVGGSYCFMHQTLRNHFAGLSFEQRKR
jgi:DNA polymerase III delta prime subunit